MFTTDQKEYLEQRFKILTQDIVSQVVKEVSSKIEECETTRCCKGVDFHCLATKQETSIYTRANVLRIVGIVLVTMLFVEWSGGIEAVLRGIAIKSTSINAVQ